MSTKVDLKKTRFGQIEVEVGTTAMIDERPHSITYLRLETHGKSLRTAAGSAALSDSDKICIAVQGDDRCEEMIDALLFAVRQLRHQRKENGLLIDRTSITSNF